MFLIIREGALLAEPARVLRPLAGCRLALVLVPFHAALWGEPTLLGVSKVFLSAQLFFGPVADGLCAGEIARRLRSEGRRGSLAETIRFVFKTTFAVRVPGGRP